MNFDREIKIKGFPNPNPKGVITAFYEQEPHYSSFKNAKFVDRFCFLIRNKIINKDDSISLMMFTPASYAKIDYRLVFNEDVLYYYNYLGIDRDVNQFTVHKMLVKHKPEYVFSFDKYEV